MGKWKIFYSDGSTFSDEDGAPSEAPKRGAQVICIEEGRCGRRVLKLSNYYMWSPTLNRWLDQESETSVFLRAAQEPWTVILFGEYLIEKQFETILIAAHNDPYIPMVTPDGPPHPAWRG